MTQDLRIHLLLADGTLVSKHNNSAIAIKRALKLSMTKPCKLRDWTNSEVWFVNGQQLVKECPVRVKQRANLTNSNLLGAF
jgi:hypothetical protein